MKDYNPDDFTHIFAKREGRYVLEDLKTGEYISTDDFVKLIKRWRKANPLPIDKGFLLCA